MVCKPHGKRQGWLSKGSEWTIENQQTQALTFFSESGDTDDYCLLMEDGHSWRPYGPDRDIRIRHCESSRHSLILQHHALHWPWDGSSCQTAYKIDASSQPMLRVPGKPPS